MRINIKELVSFSVLMVFISFSGPAFGGCADEIRDLGINSSESALNVKFEVLEGISDRQALVYLSAVKDAVSILKRFAPEGDHLFKWSGDKRNLENKTVTIVLSTSTAAQALLRSESLPIVIERNYDSLTLAVGNRAGNFNIFTFILVDRIFSPEKERTYLGHLVSSLAFEIFGVIQEKLKIDMGNPPAMTETYRNAKQMEASTASLSLLKRVMASFEFQSYSVDIQIGFQNALKKEIKILQFWRLRAQGLN